ncbi:MAG: NUDIX domain-containing protein [Phycisphaerae bacterium]|nr:NUDIX domain-containing protein [Phycisphaerae bacterium]
MGKVTNPILQAGAIPFRLDQRGEFDVLLIRRASRRKWNIPKGLVEPDQTAADAALAEAYEEAGVAGELSQSPVGAYVYEKYEHRLLVHVYLLRVVDIHDDYPEQVFRRRRWFSQSDAIRSLRRPALRDLIIALPRFVRRGPGGRIAYVPHLAEQNSESAA